MVKITTFKDRPVRHVRCMPDGTVILKLYERRPNRRASRLWPNSLLHLTDEVPGAQLP